jgi:hypothetical protein
MKIPFIKSQALIDAENLLLDDLYKQYPFSFECDKNLMELFFSEMPFGSWTWYQEYFGTYTYLFKTEEDAVMAKLLVR